MKNLRRAIFLLLLLSNQVIGQEFSPYFEGLTKQLRLNKPRLPRNSYQVRLWVNLSLAVGEAEELYLITQKRKKLSLEKRTLFHTKEGFLRSKVDFKVSLKETTFFNELIANAVLSSRDQSIITDSLYNVYRSFKQTTRVEIQDGEVQVIFNKPPKLTMLLDGTTYHFEVMGNGFFRKYKFHSPKAYAKMYPELGELSRNVDLVRRIFIAFLEKRREISLVECVIQQNSWI
ncbi:MAG TPA: hypothetical protein DCR35_14160 [Runella sp.]|nr:hypothetical protein [Runella sp.]